MNDILVLILSKANYWMTIALMMVGLYAMIAKQNLVKKIIGMNILQTAVILFFISIGAKRDASIPIAMHSAASHNHLVHAADYINPLPHVLMLTAIVVAGTIGPAHYFRQCLHRWGCLACGVISTTSTAAYALKRRKNRWY